MGQNFSVLTGYSVWDRTSVYSLVTQYGTELKCNSLVAQCGTELQCTDWLLSMEELKCSSLVAQYGTELQCSSLVTQYGTEIQCAHWLLSIGQKFSVLTGC